MHSVLLEDAVVAARHFAWVARILGRGMQPKKEIVAIEGGPGVWPLSSSCPGLQVLV